MKRNDDRDGKCSAKCNCTSGVDRRDFLKIAGVGSMVVLGSGMPVMAGPFEAADFAKLVPADKKLDPEWVKSLTARGSRTVYRGAELEKIRMPIGGLCAGQLYLGGDGKLWRWDIFNRTAGTGDGGYAHPPQPDHPIDQGFAIQLTSDGKATTRTLDRGGFSDITFTGEYPLGCVEYRDPASTLAVSLEAFSPLVPLDVDNSSYPATVMRFTVKNTGSRPIEGALVGWLENTVCKGAGSAAGRRQNRLVRKRKVLWLDCATAPATVKQTDAGPADRFEQRPDFGTMGLGLLHPRPDDVAEAVVSAGPVAVDLSPEVKRSPEADAPLGTKLVGRLARPFRLAPGESATAEFVLAWYFPNLKLKDGGRYYATRFSSAAAVADRLADDLDSLYRQTRLWHDTWYDSTLPHWFLDRTFLNTSILATSTAHRFGTGRFWGWEGVGCCEGTCTHVWHYAHAVARLFPELERDLRRRTDFGTAMDPKSGVIQHRGESCGLAVDGQAGCILRAYREHQMSPDAEFLKSLLPKIKLAMECLARMDDGEGIIEGAQHNTLDQPWFGKVAWLSSLYIAAARACEEMAKEMGDDACAAKMRAIVERGGRNIDKELISTSTSA